MSNALPSDQTAATVSLADAANSAGAASDMSLDAATTGDGLKIAGTTAADAKLAAQEPSTTATATTAAESTTVAESTAAAEQQGETETAPAEEETVSSDADETTGAQETAPAADTEAEAETEAAADEKTETAADEEAVSMPAVTFSEHTDEEDVSKQMTVSVDAPEGAFPAGTTMTVKPVGDDEILTKAEDAAGLEAGQKNTDEANTTKLLKKKAVEITFHDANGAEIEPQAAIQVSISSDELAEAADKPQIVHVKDDGEAEKIDPVPDEELTRTPAENEVIFRTNEFSVYAVVYTVDFEYSVNGKMYQFSLPGGGFVSFTDLVEVLGIIGDTNSEENGDENGSVSAENTEENAANERTEENSVNSDTNTALTLGDVEVSEATRKFVEDVASVEFSSPELVDVSKVDADTTVGQIKEGRGLECQYSAELTEAQIAEINAQTVEAGDWALISVQPFTSEEQLTVTMKDGEVFTIRVTDASYSITPVTNLNGAKGALINPVRKNAVQSTAHSNGRLQAAAVSIDSASGTVTTTDPAIELTEWTFTRVGESGNNYYIHSSAGYLNIDYYGKVTVSSQT